MNKGKIEELIKKYEEGTSNLSEEQLLLDNVENLNPTVKPWFKFIKLTKRTAPQHLYGSLWESIQTARIKKRRFTIGIISAAASVIILISLSIFNLGYEKRSFKKKEALLSEALQMFENTDYQVQIEKNIIYEDNMIIIYTALK
jgi:hypothetical protein